MPGPLSQAIARILSEAFDASDLTQEQLGAAIDRDQSTVSRFLSGKVTMDMEEFSGICRALGVSPVEVLAGGVRATFR